MKENEGWYKIDIEDWLYKNDNKKIIDKLQDAYYAAKRGKRKVVTFFKPKYSLEKEHKEIGLKYSDRPLKEHDGYDCAVTLAWIMYPKLVRFQKAKRNTVPATDSSRIKWVICMSYNEDNSPENLKEIETAVQEWQTIIDKIVAAVRALLLDEDDKDEVVFKEGMALFAEYFDCLWD